ncbi:MAG: hypothetical protein QF747_02975, partial [Patescibacteria group bacterium]|nr:hypothetical protein [Patescibacteria group bacterium]
MKQIKFLILGLLFVVAGFLLGLGVNKDSDTVISDDSASQEEQVRATSMMIDTGDDLLGFNDIAINETETVWTLLSRLSQKSEDLSVSST